VLHDGGYLDRFRPVRRIGSAEWIYRLSARGWKALTSQEMVDGSGRCKPAAFTSISYTAHDLQLSTLILRIALDAGGSYDHGLIDTDAVHLAGASQRAHRLAAAAPRTRRSGLARRLRPRCARRARLGRARRARPECARQRRALAGRTAAAGHAPLSVPEPKRLSRARRHPDRRFGRGPLRGADRVRPHRPPAPADRSPAPLRLVAARGWRDTHFARHSMAPGVVFVTSRERPLRRL